MKKGLLLSGVLLSSVCDLSAAGWNGFYVRTDLAVMGGGNSHKKNDAPALAGKKEGSTERLMHLSVAGGWGRVFSGGVYAGADATMLGLSGVMHGMESNEFSFLYDPKITARVGFARCNMLVYAGGGVGALYALSEKEKLRGYHAHFPKNSDDKAELQWTWHARIGADFKLKGNWTAGVFYEYQRSIAHKNEGDKTLNRTDMSLVNDRVAFVFGYQM